MPFPDVRHNKSVFSRFEQGKALGNKPYGSIFYKKEPLYMNETKRKPGIIDQLRAKPRRFFLVDGIGALLTIILLVAVVARFEDSFGMPGNVVYGLSILACFYAVYSFSCYLFTPRRWRPYLKLIAIANLAYCCLTMGLLFYCIQRLTILGWLYFLIEIIIIAGLALIELNTDYHDLQDRQDKVT